MTFNKRTRYAEDAERTRLRELDRQNNGKRLLNWTIETRQNEVAEMARKKASEKQPSPAENLSAALAFVSVAGTKDDAAYKQHVILNNGFAVISDGQLTAGFPIAEQLECCPHLKLLTAAINRCGASLAIAELENGQLSVTGDKLKATVPCLPFTAMPDAAVLAPDASIASIDDRLKAAFAVCGVLASEAATSFVEASLLLEANTCTATNRATLMQYWHGIDLPPGLAVPKIFAAAVAKIKTPLKGFGWTQGRSITFHFEDGSWLKTLLYEDKYPDVVPIIEKPSQATPVPEGLFEAIETVSEFDEGGNVYLKAGCVASRGDADAEASYEVEGLAADMTFKAQQTKLIAPFVKSIDLTTYEDRAFFFGENMRGVVMGVVHPKEPTYDASNFEIGADFKVQAEEIPF